MKLFADFIDGKISKDEISTALSAYGVLSVRLRPSKDNSNKANIEITNDDLFMKHLAAKGGKAIKIAVGGSFIFVKEDQFSKQKPAAITSGQEAQLSPTGCDQTLVDTSTPYTKLDPMAPYDFKPRQIPSPLEGPYRQGKKKPEAFHDRLLDDRYDIAFEITWRLETPTAANPCTDKGEECCPAQKDSDKKEYSGYNKRWLMIGGRPAISPFTVKSAIANGFASLLGGCYRVVSHKVKHAELKDGHFPYGGRYKRYRVSMDGDCSKPGLLKKVEKIGDYYHVEVTPVEEFYYDSDQFPDGLVVNDKDPYFAVYNEVKQSNGKRNIISPLELRTNKGIRASDEKLVRYYGEYEFGMDLSLKKGELGKKHYHRFYSEMKGVVAGDIPAINFASGKELSDEVYMGKFNRMKKAVDTSNDRVKLDGGLWCEDWSALRKEVDEKGCWTGKQWVYYQTFHPGGIESITNIGKNFQFKALFLHEDTVPADAKSCTDMEMLCPRCAMFGMTDSSGEKERDAVGFMGRFKAATLMAKGNELKPVAAESYRIPKTDKGPDKTYGVTYHNDPAQLLRYALTGDDKPVMRQFLLPILGEPKPNKRDMDGYFDKSTGMLKGAKYYLHSGLTFEKLKELIRDRDPRPIIEGNGDTGLPYAHNLRNYAMVCREGLEFGGTVGAENCSVEETAALLMLLETEIDNEGVKNGSGKSIGHGFKIGLGKSLGLGSVSSTIGKIWVRSVHAKGDPGECAWKAIPVSKGTDFKALGISGLGEALEMLLTVQDKLNSWPERITDKRPQYPKPGTDYWKAIKRRKSQA